MKITLVEYLDALACAVEGADSFKPGERYHPEDIGRHVATANEAVWSTLSWVQWQKQQRERNLSPVDLDS